MKKKYTVAALLLSVALVGCSGTTTQSVGDDATLEAADISAETVAKAISDIQAEEDGNVTVYLADGRYFDLGNLKGNDGKDGAGVSNAEVNENGELIISLSDGTTINSGNVRGADGKNGTDGASGTDGIGVQSSVVNENGELIITLTDGTTLNNGVVKGKGGRDGTDGKDGRDGVDGKDGRDGIDGKNGRDGTDGKDAVNGKETTEDKTETKEWPIGTTFTVTEGLPGICNTEVDAFTMGKFNEVIHVEDISMTIVGKYADEECTSLEDKKKIVESYGLTWGKKFQNQEMNYAIKWHLKGYVENLSGVSYVGSNYHFTVSASWQNNDGTTGSIGDASIQKDDTFVGEGVIFQKYISYDKMKNFDSASISIHM